tara:strand:- start:225 stop:593 length:369 start_codon:yes stop_codon:yes gene_type:complete
MEKVSHQGNLATKTDFRVETGGLVRIEVWLTTICTVSNQATYYNCNVSTKGRGCRNWVFEFRSEGKDGRILELITEEQLYTAYHNHWIKLNPIRIFSGSRINGELTNFTVTEKEYQSKHYVV